MFTITGIFYIVAGIQYWTANYMITVLLIDKAVATSFVAATSITAPISGVLVGGLVTAFYGGYNAKKSQTIVLINGWACVACAIPIPLVSGLYPFGLFIWLLLFFGGFILPTLLGMMLSAVPYKLRGSANSIAQFSYNAFGYMPAPFIYGLMSELVDPTSRYQTRIPMGCIVYTSAISITLASIVIGNMHKKNLQKNWMEAAEQLYQDQQEAKDLGIIAGPVEEKDEEDYEEE